MRLSSKAAMLAISGLIALVVPGHAAPECGGGGVYVFDASWCPDCKRVKGLLNRLGVGYTSIDMTNNRRARVIMAERFDTIVVPVTVIDSSLVLGINETRLRQLLCLI